MDRTAPGKRVKKKDCPGGILTTKSWRTHSGHHLIDFHSTKTVEYLESALEDIQPGIFYVPELTDQDQAAYDLFFLENGSFYIFQFLTASDHPIKPVPFFSQLSLPPKTMWHFVFVIPTGSESVAQNFATLS